MPPAKVFFRVFPAEKIDFSYIKLDTIENKIYVRYLQDLAKHSKSTKPSYWEFETHGIFLNVSQETVYRDVEEGVLENIFDGYNAIILIFGQTGSGKTYTASGITISDEEFGILPRVAKDLLKLKKLQPKNYKINIQMSYVEFYNTYALDLLKRFPDPIECHKCREVRKVDILNELDALRYIFIGEGRKNFVQNKSPYLSNVATTVATFHIIKRNMDLTNPTKVVSRLHIVDMAGNDNIGNASHLHKNAKEIGLANVTKSQMEQFILCLLARIPEHVRIKQRINSLMYYLDGDFSYDSVLRLIGHIKLDKEDLITTLATLRFGKTVLGLKMKKKEIQFEMNDELELDYLREKIKSLEKEKHLNSVLLNRDLVTGMNQARVSHLDKLINDYLANGIREITVINVADTEAVLQKMKQICIGYQNDFRNLQTENQMLQRSGTNLKSKISRSGSQLSGSKGSSRTGSKEVLKQRPSIQSSDTRRKSAEQNSEVELPAAKRKRSLKPTSCKGKFSNASLSKQDSKGSIRSNASNLLIPNMIPEKQEAWSRFTSNSLYKERVEEYKLNEKEVQKSFETYDQEIKNMRKRQDILENSRKHLLMAQTFRRFNARDEFDEDGNLILSLAEIECKSHLENAQTALLNQQEKVLSAQEALKANLENRRNIFKKLEGEFDQYCFDNFKIPSLDVEIVQTDLDKKTTRVNVERPFDAGESQEEITFIPEPSFSQQLLANLKTLMALERKRRNQFLVKKNNEWKKY